MMCTLGHIHFHKYLRPWKAIIQEDRLLNNTLTSFAFSLVHQQEYRDQGIVRSSVSTTIRR